MYKKSTQLLVDNLLIVFLFLMILPFLILNIFNNPTPEDFSWVDATHRLGFMEAQFFLYKYWSGRFFSYTFLSVNPLLFKSFAGYKVLSLLLMCGFFYATYLLISEITRDTLAFKEKLLFSLSILFLYLYAMPSPAEGFYWLTAAAIYHLGIILILIFFTFYIRLCRTNNLSARTLYISISSLIAIAIAGTSELSASLFLMILILFVIISLFSEKKIKLPLIIFTLITLIAVYISFTSPGNFSRTEQFPNAHQFFYSIYNSFTFLIQKLFSWTFNSPLLAITLLLVPIIYKLVNDGKNNLHMFSINPFYFLFLFFIILFNITFITFWNIGRTPFYRSANFIYFIFLAGWFFNITVLMVYVKKKFNWNFKHFPKYLYVTAFIIIALFMIKKNNVQTAYSELLKGSAYEYDNKLKDRYDLILQTKADSCQVDSIKNIPRTFFFLDITDDPDFVYNKWYASYFNKKSISLKKSVLPQK